MKTQIVQAFTPQDLKVAVDAIILADTPTFIHITEMICARGSFLICWLP